MKGGDIFHSLHLSVGWMGEEKHTRPKSTKGALRGSHTVPKNLQKLVFFFVFFFIQCQEALVQMKGFECNHLQGQMRQKGSGSCNTFDIWLGKHILFPRASRYCGLLNGNYFEGNLHKMETCQLRETQQQKTV